jgi:hypothetical protein
MAEAHKKRRHPKYRTKYRVKNWAEYEKSLRARGDITVWVNSDVVKAWTPLQNGKRGAQKVYSDLVVKVMLTLRLLFHLPLRQTEGFLESILNLMGLDLPCPDHTTLSRRNQSVEVCKQLAGLPPGPVSFIVDSTGLKVCGQGEWHSKKHGKKQRRKWMKLHIGVDEKGWILTSKITDGDEQDPGQIPDLLNQFDGVIDTFVGDGIYDQAGVYKFVKAHSPKATIVIPPRKNSIVSTDHPDSKTQRDGHIKCIQESDHFKWKRTSGYYKQSHAENTIARYKTIFGGGLHAKRKDSQEKEIKIACGLLNRMTSLGSPDSYPVI